LLTNTNLKSNFGEVRERAFYHMRN